MTTTLQSHYTHITCYNFLLKCNFPNIFKIPTITKICLNIGFKEANFSKKKLINILLLLKLITNQKPTLTRSKKNIIFLKIKKNSIIGCKITLRKKKMFFFLERILLFISPNLKIKNSQNNHILNFQITTVLDFFELKTEFIKFKELPSIDVSIHTTAKTEKELFILSNSLYLVYKD